MPALEPTYVRGAMRLLGSGIAVPVCPSPNGPKAVITNADMTQILHDAAPTDRGRQAATRLLAHSGCTTRHWSHWIGSAPNREEITTADLAAEAAEHALKDAGLTADDLDLVILALSTSTLPTIATATPLGDRLGYKGPSFDLKAGCAGTLYALQLASCCLAAGYRRILVVGADTMSKYLDATSLAGFINVGDGAGALVLGSAPEPNFVAALYGDYDTWLTAGVFDVLPPQAEATFCFQGAPTRLREPIALNLRQALADMLAHESLPASQIERWIPHQLGPALLEEVARSFGRPGLALFLNHDRYGNTGAASLAIALHEARPTAPPGWTALTALGGGMRWGAALWRNYT